MKNDKLMEYAHEYVDITERKYELARDIREEKNPIAASLKLEHMEELQDAIEQDVIRMQEYERFVKTVDRMMAGRSQDV